MASPADNSKAVHGEAGQHTCNASPVHYTLARPKFFVPTGHPASDRWPPAPLLLEKLLQNQHYPVQYPPVVNMRIALLLNRG
jgi:hypothetical protein